MKSHICENLKHLLGQPVRIYTDDERVVTGMVVGVNAYCVRILARNQAIFQIDADHIDAIEEPQMRLRRREYCACERECEDDD